MNVGTLTSCCVYADKIYINAQHIRPKYINVKVRTLDIAPLRERPPQKRVLKGFHSFACTPTRLIRNRNAPYLPFLPSQLIAGTYLPTSEGWNAGLACRVVGYVVRQFTRPYA